MLRPQLLEAHCVDHFSFLEDDKGKIYVSMLRNFLAVHVVKYAVIIKLLYSVDFENKHISFADDHASF